MSVVLDASVTLAWLVSEESTGATASVLDLVGQSGAWVPAIWHLEVANGLRQAVTRGRIDSTKRESSFADLSKLSIAVDAETSMRAWTVTLSLSDRFGLTAYDAAYLELAERRSLPLATLDRELRRAGERLGIQLLGL